MGNVSLFIILIISLVNLLKASYLETAHIPEGTADLFFHIFDWAEAILLGLVPVIVFGFLVLALLARLLIQIDVKVRERRGQQPSQTSMNYLRSLHRGHSLFNRAAIKKKRTEKRRHARPSFGANPHAQSVRSPSCMDEEKLAMQFKMAAHGAHHRRSSC